MTPFVADPPPGPAPRYQQLPGLFMVVPMPAGPHAPPMIPLEQVKANFAQSPHLANAEAHHLLRDGAAVAAAAGRPAPANTAQAVALFQKAAQVAAALAKTNPRLGLRMAALDSRLDRPIALLRYKGLHKAITTAHTLEALQQVLSHLRENDMILLSRKEEIPNIAWVEWFAERCHGGWTAVSAIAYSAFADLPAGLLRDAIIDIFRARTAAIDAELGFQRHYLDAFDPANLRSVFTAWQDAEAIRQRAAFARRGPVSVGINAGVAPPSPSQDAGTPADNACVTVCVPSRSRACLEALEQRGELLMWPDHMIDQAVIAHDRIVHVASDDASNSTDRCRALRLLCAESRRGEKCNFVVTPLGSAGRSHDGTRLSLAPRRWKGQRVSEGGVKHAQIAYAARPGDGWAIFAGTLWADFISWHRNPFAITFTNNSGEYGRRATEHSLDERLEVVRDAIQKAFPFLGLDQIFFEPK
ncbi:MAG: hypothetical protein HYV02_05240 [Deltaproteobacteria bacterium]|nr:hypothetical protein [Deltaproteobacteria bacterium]